MELNPFLDERGRTALLMVDLAASLLGKSVLDGPPAAIEAPGRAVDIAVQAQVLDLIARLQQQMTLAGVFITQDLRVTAQLCHRLLVIPCGLIVEQGQTTMKFYFSERQLAHQPRQYMIHGKLVHAYENNDRATALLTALAEAGLTRHEAQPGDHAMIDRVHADHFLAFLRTAHAEFTALPNAGDEVLPNIHPYRGADAGFTAREKPRPTGIIGRAGWYVGDLSAVIMAGPMMPPWLRRKLQLPPPRLFSLAKAPPSPYAARRATTPISTVPPASAS